MSITESKLPFYIEPAATTPYYISAGDTVKLAVMHFPDTLHDVSVIYEIWDVGGAQPPNMHENSVETFFFLSGSGVAHCDDSITEISSGGFLLLPPGTTHRIINTGKSRLYAVTTMSPDAGFAKMITSGIPTNFDPEDLDILQRLT